MRDSMHFYLQKVLVAQEEERKRIARELHDDAGQSLLLLAHQLDAIASDSRSKLSKPVQEKLTQVHDLAVETLNGLRRYAQELRPAILDDMGLVASDGEEAVKLSAELKPDIIIMDIVMPKLSGIEATKQIRKVSPTTAVLVLTAYDDDRYVIGLLEAGAAG
ncbi:unnamed protein product, partial [marine sediment metagenome]